MRKLLSIVLIGALCSVSSAQISISRSEIPDSVGYTNTMLVSANQTVNLGTTGGNQRWDFSAVSRTAVPNVDTYISPNATPWGTTFNWGTSTSLRYAQMATRGSDLVGGMLDTSGLFTYYRFSNTAFEMLGMGIFGDTLIDSQAVKFTTAARLALIPLNYNATWWDSVKATIDLPDTGGVDLKARVNIRLQHTVDAWGTVLFPNDSASCLRQVTVSSGNIQIGTILFNIFIPVQTMGVPAETEVSFIAENKGVVVSCRSDTAVTTPNFTNAVSLRQNGQRWSSAPEPVSGALPNNLELSAYPNPFNPTTKLSFASDVSGNGTLTISDILGRTVAVVYHGDVQAGQTYSAGWSSKVASGVYFARLTVNGRSKTVNLLKVQ